MKFALAALLFSVITRQAAGQPAPLLPGHRHLVASPNTAFEFETAIQANSFLRERREKRASRNEEDTSFAHPKERLRPVNPKMRPKKNKAEQPKPTSCFPGSGSSTVSVPNTPFDKSQDWWCPQETEYAFLGFSYDISGCQGKDSLTNDFKNMRSTYSSRYVRIYGNCDQPDYYNQIVDAAADASIGVYALIWFGFNGDEVYKPRMDSLINIMKTNPRAPYVVRSITVGSEPLYDHAVSVDKLAELLGWVRSELSVYGTELAISEMPWGYQSNNLNGDSEIVKQQDMMQLNVLPFFDGQASTGWNAWGIVEWSIGFARDISPGKPIRLTQTGWPSNDSIWKANSPNGVASVDSEKEYFDLLDSKCDFMKSTKTGWFAHIYEDNTLSYADPQLFLTVSDLSNSGWGIVQGGQPKFDFHPRTSC